MLFEQFVLPVICVVGVLAILAYAKRDRQREAALGARKRALNEARSALLSLAEIARRAGRTAESHGDVAAQASYDRAYYYDRAAMIVASIPVDRL